MSRGREWAEELAAMAAEEHGRTVPSDDHGRVVLTAEERSMGWRADKHLWVKRLLAPKVKAAIQEVADSFDRVRQTIEAAGSNMDEFIAKVKAMGKDDDPSSPAHPRSNDD